MSAFSYSSVSLPFTAPFPPLCHLPEYTRCCGAKHPLGLQQSQTEGSGGGEGRENDKCEQGGSWGQLKIVHRRGGARDGESAGRTSRETQAGLYLDGLRMKCFAARTGEESFHSRDPHSNATTAIFDSSFHKMVSTRVLCGQVAARDAAVGSHFQINSSFSRFVTMAIHSPQYRSEQLTWYLFLLAHGPAGETFWGGIFGFCRHCSHSRAADRIFHMSIIYRGNWRWTEMLGGWTDIK